MATAQLLAKLRGDSSQFRSEVNKAGKSVGELKSVASELAGPLAGLFTIAGVTALGREAIEAASKFQNWSQKLGVSTDFVQQLSFAAKQCDSDLESVGGAMLKLERAQAKATAGNEEAINSFAALGVSVEQVKSLSPEELFLAVADGVANAADDGAAFNAAAEVMGKQVGDLLPLLRQGKTGIEAMFAKAPVMASETVNALDDLGKEFERFKGDLLPGLAMEFSLVAGAVDFVSKKIQQLGAFLGAIVNTFAGAFGSDADGANEAADALERGLRARLAAGKITKQQFDEQLAQVNKTRNTFDNAFTRAAVDFGNQLDEIDKRFAKSPNAADRSFRRDAGAVEDAERLTKESAERKEIEKQIAKLRQEAHEAALTDEQRLAEARQRFAEASRRLLNSKAGSLDASNAERDRLEAQKQVAELQRRAEQQAEQRAKNLASLDEKLAEVRRKGKLEALNGEQKINELVAERRELLRKIAAETDEAKRKQLTIEAAERANDIAAMQREADARRNAAEHSRQVITDDLRRRGGISVPVPVHLTHSAFADDAARATAKRQQVTVPIFSVAHSATIQKATADNTKATSDNTRALDANSRAVRDATSRFN